MSDDPAPWPEVITDLGLEFGWRPLGLPFAIVRHLVSIGVPQAFVARLTGASDLARARIALGNHGLFGWDGDTIALLLAVRDQGAVVDVCAVRSSEPEEWHLLTGAGWILGDEWLRGAQIGTVSRLRLFGNPLEWLRGAGAGICLLEWSREAISALRSLGDGVTLLCDDDGAADRLRDILTRGGLPIVQSCKGRMAA